MRRKLHLSKRMTVPFCDLNKLYNGVWRQEIDFYHARGVSVKLTLTRYDDWHIPAFELITEQLKKTNK